MCIFINMYRSSHRDGGIMIEHGALDIFPGGEMKLADTGFSGNVGYVGG
jgi:hypothetical protein